MSRRRDIFSDLTQVANGAASALSALRQEVQTVRQSRDDRQRAKADMVTREDFDALSLRVDTLASRIAVIEARLDSATQKPKPRQTKKKSAPKRT